MVRERKATILDHRFRMELCGSQKNIHEFAADILWATARVTSAKIHPTSQPFFHLSTEKRRLIRKGRKGMPNRGMCYFREAGSTSLSNKWH
ncbi:uncharacterized protein LOC144115240 isoform X2 [Amblyomma americanum]